MRMLAIVVASILVSGAALAADSVGPTRSKAPKGAKVMIVSPKDGATVGPDVAVSFGVEGIALKPAGDPTPDSGHHHLLIDQKELPPLDAPIPNDVTHKHYGKAQVEDTIHLEPGRHTLQLDYGDAAHMQFDPPIVSKRITVIVEGAKP